MSNKELLTIYPPNLQFHFELKKQFSSSFYLTNKTDNHVAFKVMMTNTENYIVTPNNGVISPGCTFEVVVTMQAQEEAPSDMQCKDKFMIEAVIAYNHGLTMDKFTPEMFSKEARHLVEEATLGVTYVFSSTCTTTPCHNKLLTIEPLELKFRVVSSKVMSHDIVLTNKTDNQVAYKVTPTNPGYYLSSRSKGVVCPRSNSILKVFMHPPEEAPSRAQQCKDKFIFRAITHDFTEEQVTNEMFSKESGHLVEETTVHIRLDYPSTRCICL